MLTIKAMIFTKKRKSWTDDVLGINERNLDYVYAYNERKYFPLADDKVLCKEVLHKHDIACAETYGVIEKMRDIETVWKEVQHHSALAIKPANGSGGGGIMILKKNKLGEWTKGGRVVTEDFVFRSIAELIMGMYSFGTTDRVLIEQCIISHSFFHEIYPVGVPDFRIILLKNKPVMGMLRIPTEKSDGKANLQQGGLGIGIDMEKGQLKLAFDGKKYHQHHPDNGNIITGKLIPYWKELIHLSIKTSEVFPLNYLGIDIVIDQNLGPMIMEINVRPGLGIQLANQQGLKPFLNNLNVTQGA